MAQCHAPRCSCCFWYLLDTVWTTGSVKFNLIAQQKAQSNSRRFRDIPAHTHSPIYHYSCGPHTLPYYHRPSTHLSALFVATFASEGICVSHVVLARHFMFVHPSQDPNIPIRVCVCVCVIHVNNCKYPYTHRDTRVSFITARRFWRLLA